MKKGLAYVEDRTMTISVDTNSANPLYHVETYYEGKTSSSMYLDCHISVLIDVLPVICTSKSEFIIRYQLSNHTTAPCKCVFKVDAWIMFRFLFQA